MINLKNSIFFAVMMLLFERYFQIDKNIFEIFLALINFLIWSLDVMLRCFSYLFFEFRKYLFIWSSEFCFILMLKLCVHCKHVLLILSCLNDFILCAAQFVNQTSFMYRYICIKLHILSTQLYIHKVTVYIVRN